MSGADFYVYFTQHGVGAFQNEVFATWCTFKDWVSATGIGHSCTIYSAIEKRQVEMRVKREGQHCKLKEKEEENAKEGSI
jgi:hypothetical protein